MFRFFSLFSNVLRETGLTLRPKQRICLQICLQKRSRKYFGYSAISMNALFIEIVLCFKMLLKNKMQNIPFLENLWSKENLLIKNFFLTEAII